MNKKTKNEIKPIHAVINKQKLTNPPIWLMRQAGRYLPEYMKISKKENFLTRCKTPSLAAEITMQPIERFKHLDAAIIFSDILLIAEALGCGLDFIDGFGPKIDFDISKELLKPEEIQEKIHPTLEAIKKVRTLLDDSKSLIGFAGSPWTVLSYIIEGSGSNNYRKTMKFCYSEPQKTKCLLKTITEATIIYLIKQIESGVDVIQLFDSNAGLLTENMFQHMVLEPTKQIVSTIKKHKSSIKIIGFPRGSGIFYKKYSSYTGVDAISIDQFTPIEWAKNNINQTLQGNFDPFTLAYRKEKIKNDVCVVKKLFNNAPFIFNLGHGVLPDTPVENVEKLIECVKFDC